MRSPADCVAPVGAAAGRFVLLRDAVVVGGDQQVDLVLPGDFVGDHRWDVHGFLLPDGQGEPGTDSGCRAGTASIRGRATPFRPPAPRGRSTPGASRPRRPVRPGPLVAPAG